LLTVNCKWWELQRPHDMVKKRRRVKTRTRCHLIEAEVLR
jgi:hypothetical protein